MIKKICRDCKAELEINEDNFRRHPNGTFRPECRKCESMATIARANKRAGKENTTLEEVKAARENNDEEQEKRDYELSLDNLVQGLIGYCNHNLSKVHYTLEEDFWYSHPTAEEVAVKFNIDFQQIKEVAEEVLKEEYGLKYPADKTFGEGLYLVVGDSHGKHMKTCMFQLLKNLDSVFNFDRIFHIGHILDEDSVMSYHWKPMEKVTIISKKEEIRRIAELLKYWDEEGIDYNFNIIRDSIKLGNLTVRNQDQFPNEYTTVALDKLEQMFNQEHSLVNFHRHEMFSMPTWEDKNLMFMSPGCLCEQFVNKTARILDFTTGRGVVQTFADGYNQYRRRGELKNLWEQGLYIVHVDADNSFSVVPCRIKDVAHKVKATAYFNTIITSEEKDFQHTADTFNVVTGDAHVPRQDPEALAIINNFISDFEFNKHINLGDVCQNDAVNHHNLDKKNIQKYATTSVLADFANSHNYIAKTKDWAEDHYLIFANHERFARDFIEKWPQFEELLDVKKLLRLDKLGIELIEHQQITELDGSIYLHGDIKSYGQRGKIYEKVGRNFDTNKWPAFIGHIHYPCIRFGCYSVGMTGLMDQDYDEPTASRWMHGFGMAASYKNISWNTTIPIIDGILYFNGKHYGNVSIDEIDYWNNPEKIDFKISYEY